MGSVEVAGTILGGGFHSTREGCETNSWTEDENMTIACLLVGLWVALKLQSRVK